MVREISVNKKIAVPKVDPSRSVHPLAEKKALSSRIAKAIGHLKKVQLMVASDSDCLETINQLLAVRSELTNAGRMLLKSQLTVTFLDADPSQMASEVDELSEAIARFVK